MSDEGRGGHGAYLSPAWDGDRVIDRNLEDVFLASRLSMEKKLGSDQTLPRKGASIQIDETAMEQEATYHRVDSDMIDGASAGKTGVGSEQVDTMVGGGCFTCTPVEATRMRDQASVEAYAENLENGTMHLGNNLTACALKVFGESGVSTMMAAPSCKGMTAEQTVELIKRLIDAIRRNPALLRFIQLWAVVTDGDASRRLAGYLLVMRHFLGEVDYLASRSLPPGKSAKPLPKTNKAKQMVWRVAPSLSISQTLHRPHTHSHLLIGYQCCFLNS